MSLKKIVKIIARKMGLAISRYPTPEERRLGKIFEVFQIDLLLDVGANTGQYVQYVRDLGYKNQVISFEPVSVSFQELNRKASLDPLWQVHQRALGSKAGSNAINISANSFSSSLLEILPSHLNAAPQSKVIDKEMITIETLDHFLEGMSNLSKRIFLKIDTQGYELEVLKGAEKILPEIICVQIELSLIPLYKTETMYDELLTFFKEKGFELYTLEPGFFDEQTGRLLQMDGVFVNKKYLKQ